MGVRIYWKHGHRATIIFFGIFNFKDTDFFSWLHRFKMHDLISFKGHYKCSHKGEFFSITLKVAENPGLPV